MARNQRREQPVSDDELEEMDDQVADHFDRVRERLDEELEDEELSPSAGRFRCDGYCRVSGGLSGAGVLIFYNNLSTKSHPLGPLNHRFANHTVSGNPTAVCRDCSGNSGVVSAVSSPLMPARV